MYKSAYKINIILSTKILRNFRIVKSMAQKQSLTIECLNWQFTQFAFTFRVFPVESLHLKIISGSTTTCSSGRSTQEST